MPDIGIGVKVNVDPQTAAQVGTSLRDGLRQVAPEIQRELDKIKLSFEGQGAMGSVGAKAASQAGTIASRAIEQGQISPENLGELRRNLGQVNALIRTTYEERVSTIRRSRERAIQETVTLSEKMAAAEKSGATKQATAYKDQLERAHKAIPDEAAMRSRIDALGVERGNALRAARRILPIFGPAGIPITPAVDNGEPGGRGERGDRGERGGEFARRGVREVAGGLGVPLAAGGMIALFASKLKEAIRTQREEFGLTRAIGPSGAMGSDEAFKSFSGQLTDIPGLYPAEAIRAQTIFSRSAGAMGGRAPRLAGEAAGVSMGFGLSADEGAGFFGGLGRSGSLAKDERGQPSVIDTATRIGQTIGETMMAGRAGEMFDAITNMSTQMSKTIASPASLSTILEMQSRLARGNVGTVSEEATRGQAGTDILATAQGAIANTKLYQLPNMMRAMMISAMVEGGVTDPTQQVLMQQKGLAAKFGAGEGEFGGKDSPYKGQYLSEVLLARNKRMGLGAEAGGLGTLAGAEMFNFGNNVQGFQAFQRILGAPKTRDIFESIDPKLRERLLSREAGGDPRKIGEVTTAIQDRESGKIPSDAVLTKRLEEIATTKLTPEVLQDQLAKTSRDVDEELQKMIPAVQGVVKVFGKIVETGTSLSENMKAAGKKVGLSEEGAGALATGVTVAGAAAATLGALKLVPWALKGAWGAVAGGGGAASAAAGGAAAATTGATAGATATGGGAAAFESLFAGGGASAVGGGAAAGFLGPAAAGLITGGDTSQHMLEFRRQKAATQQWAGLIKESSAKYGVPEDLIKAIMTQESGGQQVDPKTGRTLTGTSGEKGLMQVMPSTAEGMGISSGALDTPEGNIDAGARLLGDLWRKHKGDARLVAAEYNGGPNRRLWGAGNQKYQSDILRRLGASSAEKAAEATAASLNAAGTGPMGDAATRDTMAASPAAAMVPWTKMGLDARSTPNEARASASASDPVSTSASSNVAAMAMVPWTKQGRDARGIPEGPPAQGASKDGPAPGSPGEARTPDARPVPTLPLIGMIGMPWTKMGEEARGIQAQNDQMSLAIAPLNIVVRNEKGEIIGEQTADVKGELLPRLHGATRSPSAVP